MYKLFAHVWNGGGSAAHDVVIEATIKDQTFVSRPARIDPSPSGTTVPYSVLRDGDETRLADDPTGGTLWLAARCQDEIVDVWPPEAPTYDYPPAVPD
jgi:hypothetical protein